MKRETEKREREKRDAACFERDNRLGEKQDAYFAEVEARTGIPLAGIAACFEKLGLRLESCMDLPNSPPVKKRVLMVLDFLSRVGVGGSLSFSLRRRSARRAVHL